MRYILALLALFLALVGHAQNVAVQADPCANLLGRWRGNMPAALARVAIGPAAAMSDNIMARHWKIVEIQVSVWRGKEMLASGLIHKKEGVRFSDNASVQAAVQNLMPGDRLFIEGIKVIEPDGVTRSLNPIVLTMN